MLPRVLPLSAWSLLANHTSRSLRSTLGSFALGMVLFGCSSESNDSSPGATGGVSTGGTSTGGTSTGGVNTGGTSTGGVSTGGTSTGGTSTGGVNTGGTSTGGTSTGGSVAATGGVRSGGSGGGGTSNAGAKNGDGGRSGGGMGGAGGAMGGATATGGSGGAGTGGAAGGAKMSEGCGKAPASLKSATVNQATPVNSISVGGANRQFLTRWPTNYDNKKAYPLHIGLHGANGNLSENGKSNFGLWTLAKDSTIFVTLGAVNGLWSATTDLAYADAVLKQVESELCIDTSKVVLEGFSQGAAMSWYLTGSRPGVFRAVVGHSGGGVSGIPKLSPVAYLGSLGTDEGNGQNTQTDQFAKANGCTIDTLPRAEAGKHVCTAYKGCMTGFPVTWCSYDGGHGFQDTDSGSSTSWVPETVWQFLTPLLF